jgi:hypothetical protein
VEKPTRSQQTLAGLKNARSRGVILGRPVRCTDAEMRAVMHLRPKMAAVALGYTTRGGFYARLRRMRERPDGT